jgi:hypothetical protein
VTLLEFKLTVYCASLQGRRSRDTGSLTREAVAHACWADVSAAVREMPSGLLKELEDATHPPE